jgi:molybdopterin-guanine dinucleotide biosynthesis protein A
VLLTGGASRRMGVDKARVPVGGVPLAWRVARALAAAGGPLVEVGSGVVPWLPQVREHPAGSGPLAALVAGWRWLVAGGVQGPVVVLACDLPRVTGRTVQWLRSWPGAGSVVPVVEGRAQPLCARWSPAALEEGARAWRAGERSLRPLLAAPDLDLVSVDAWPAGLVAELADADRPEDLVGLGRAAAPGGAPTVRSGNPRR